VCCVVLCVCVVVVWLMHACVSIPQDALNINSSFLLFVFFLSLSLISFFFLSFLPSFLHLFLSLSLSLSLALLFFSFFLLLLLLLLLLIFLFVFLIPNRRPLAVVLAPPPRIVLPHTFPLLLRRRRHSRAKVTVSFVFSPQCL
jgi:hypothetical protein